MAEGEIHILAGASVYGLAYLASGGDPAIAPAIALAVMTHFPLDDLNVGSTAMIYHGMGDTTRIKIISWLLRLGILWTALGYLFWNHPAVLICALPAWLAFDAEWVFKYLFGWRDGLGLHSRMWMPWLRTQKGLFAWLIAAVMAAWIIWG